MTRPLYSYSKHHDHIEITTTLSLSRLPTSHFSSDLSITTTTNKPHTIITNQRSNNEQRAADPTTKPKRTEQTKQIRKSKGQLPPTQIKSK
jgi:hypothetical protein